MTDTEKKAAPKAKTAKVGESLTLADPAEVVRPDGTRATVKGGVYVLGVAGKYEIDGETVTVK